MPMYIISNINIHEAFTISSIQGLVVKKRIKSSNCYAHIMGGSQGYFPLAFKSFCIA
jgi:hypothetical protein